MIKEKLKQAFNETVDNLSDEEIAAVVMVFGLDEKIGEVTSPKLPTRGQGRRRTSRKKSIRRRKMKDKKYD